MGRSAAPGRSVASRHGRPLARRLRARPGAERATILTPTGISESAFWSTLRQWTETPQYILKAIRSAQIIQVEGTSDEHSKAVYEDVQKDLPTQDDEVASVATDITSVPPESGLALDEDVTMVLRELRPRNAKEPHKEFPVKERIRYHHSALFILPETERELIRGSCAGAEYTPVVSDSEKPLQDQLPFFYPKVEKYALVFCGGVGGGDKENSIRVYCQDIEGHPFPYMTKVAQSLLTKLEKWGSKYDSGSYSKRTRHDVMVPYEEYFAEYTRLRRRHDHLVASWPEQTDPQKFVFEDIAIAAYLLCIWRKEREDRGTDKLQTFVDLGCGNGLLAHILTQEGFKGKGVDVRSRKVWKMFADAGTILEETAVPCDKASFPGVDWILGNHCDELSPWLPLIAHRSGYDTRFWVLLCCFYDFDRKFAASDPKLGKYKTYLNYIESIIKRTGFEAVCENMRIPSYKSVAFTAYKRTFAEDDEEAVSRVENEIASLMQGRREFVARPYDATGFAHLKIKQ